ncbi:receptor accessory protein 3a [Silurus asotus]|uniref:Receptor expression-enhancing protein n=1 Tax=Silurus asotus TaxID=30991 RepID=A0AAD5FK93_SILAS|nr:receptor accessory protein 3a [Silurus asotus]
MVHWLLFGTLYPAYYSYKAVRTKCVKEYVRWMMYWIVFALYTAAETIADLSIAWFPLYYELKMCVVIWLVSPYTRGASLIFRKFLHPLLASREREIDDYIIQAKEKSYETMVNLGRQSLSVAASVAVTAAVKGQGAISERLRSFSIPDLTQVPSSQSAFAKPAQLTIAQGTEHGHEGHGEEVDGMFSEEESSSSKGLRRTQSVKMSRAKVIRKESRYSSLKMKTRRRPAIAANTFDQP